MTRLDFLQLHRSSLPKLISVLALTIILQWLAQPLSAAGMPEKLLVPEPPSNYRATITRSYDLAIKWQITVLNNGDLYASGKETDPDNQSVILNGDVWLRDGVSGQNGAELSLGEAFGMADTVFALYPYTLVPEAGNLQEMINELTDKSSVAKNSAIQELRAMHSKEVEQAINDNFVHMPDKACGNKTCNLFRQLFDEADAPGYADFYVDATTGFIQQIRSVHEQVTVDGETLPAWTETALYEYNVSVQWPDGSG